MKAGTIWERIVPLLLFWVSELWRWRWLFVAIVLGAIGIAIIIGLTVWLAALGFFILMLLYFHLLVRGMFQFALKVRRFRKVADTPIKLFIAPELEDATEWQTLTERLVKLRDELAQQFGFSLKRPLTVFVFPTMAEISRLFEQEMSACALPKGNGLLLAWDSLQKPYLDESLRHELAHLFSAHLGSGSPEFKREGLANWVQSTDYGKPVDFYALVALLSGNDYPLLTLLSDTRFRAAPHWTYPLAGSFTGYLVQKFGWEAYRRFYALANAENFERVFAQVFGMPLMVVEREWKQRLVKRRQEFEPEVSRWIKRTRVETAYNNWQFWQCIEEAEALLNEGDDHWGMILKASTAYGFVGNYQRALELLLSLTERNDPELRPYRVFVWEQLGNLYDLLGQRENAITAYHKALECPDWWDSQYGSAHERVRRYLKQPFSEKELYDLMRRQLTKHRG